MAPRKRKSQDSGSEESFVADDSSPSDDDDNFDSDADDRDPAGSAGVVRAKWVPDNMPRCAFGMGCTRKSISHFREESHPSRHPNAQTTSSGGGAGGSAAGAWVPAGLPRCKFGADCTRQNPAHFQSESHPPDHRKVTDYRIGNVNG